MSQEQPKHSRATPNQKFMIFDMTTPDVRSWGFISVKTLLLLGALASFSGGLCASDVTAKILRAERFEEWDTAIALSRDLSVDSPSDVPAFAAVLTACVSRGCETNPPYPVRGKLVGSQLQAFAQAWIAFSQTHPRRARDRFQALASDPDWGWLGMYGLFEYAMATRNVGLLNAVVKQGHTWDKRSKLIAEQRMDTRLLILSLTNKYREMQALLAALQDSVSPRTRFRRRLDFLIWKDDFTSAKRLLDEYVAKFGYDHAAASADFELKALLLSPHKVVAELQQRLKANPNYWELKMLGPLLYMELDPSSKEANPLKLAQELPLRLTQVRLRHMDLMARGRAEHAEQFLREIGSTLPLYVDFTDFHITAAAAFEKTNNLDSAKKHIEIASQQSSDDLSVLWAKAMLALRKGDTASGIDLLTRRVMLNPSDVNAKLILATALQFHGDYRRAAELVGEIRKSKRYIPADLVGDLERKIIEAKKGTAKR